MSTAEDPQSTGSEAPADAAGGEEADLRCDFCGEAAASVRRIALDGDYERLRTKHKPLYACEPCSERKERERGTA